MSIEFSTLVDKLNETCRKALKNAASICLANTQAHVEVEHLLLKLVESGGSDFSRLLRHYEVKPADVQKQLTLAIEKLQRGHRGTPSMAPEIESWLRESWMLASLQLGEGQIRSGCLLWALYEVPSLRESLLDRSPALARIPRQRLRQDIWEILRTSNETTQGLQTGSNAAARAEAKVLETPNLNQFTLDLTQQAREGKIDPILGRDQEIRQIIDILTRRRQNNPILTGEAGVGKTAVVEGFALRVVADQVPPTLRDISVRTLDVGLLQAGAGIRGEFEERLKSVIREVSLSPQPIILFIDEAHTLIGAGGNTGQTDAANLLKPALARGELRTIAATTWSEYKQYFEKDSALARRFQVVKVEEPDEEQAVLMLRGVLPKLEQHHRVRILDEAVWQAVKLSHRYIIGRRLPDKAVSVLDTACARVRISQTGQPPALQDLQAKITHLREEKALLNRELAQGGDHHTRLEVLEEQLAAATQECEVLKRQWESERDYFQRLQLKQVELESQSSGDKSTSALTADLAQEIQKLESEWQLVQGPDPMIFPRVNGLMVASVISGWTGIPLGKMQADEIENVLNLQTLMQRRLVGQDQALAGISRRIQTSRAGLDDPSKPVGVFLLVGPSGVGKTETALTLAELLMGDERNLITVNMSEYQEAHTVSGLKGSPPGYVGYGQGGVLTEAVRRSPYSIVLLDEIEKAHPDVLELFYQVFDKGMMEDGEGVAVDFKNTIILLTSNVGSARIQDSAASGNRPDTETLLRRIQPDLLQAFKPAFLGRLVVVPYFPLGNEHLENIVRLKLRNIAKRFEEQHGAQLEFDEALHSAIAQRSQDLNSGARKIDHLLTHSLLPELSTRILKAMAQGDPLEKVQVRVENADEFGYTLITKNQG